MTKLHKPLYIIIGSNINIVVTRIVSQKVGLGSISEQIVPMRFGSTLGEKSSAIEIIGIVAKIITVAYTVYFVTFLMMHQKIPCENKTKHTYTT